MRYYTRVGIGFAMGLALVAATSYWEKWWLVAPIGALVAVVGFLGTFFVWSADRLPEYEQVLFDGRNVAHALGLVTVLALAGFGTSFWGPHATPRAHPALVARAAQSLALSKIANDLQKASDDFKTGRLSAADAGSKVTGLIADMRGVQAAVDKLQAPAGGVEKLGHLKGETKALAGALDLSLKCIAGDANACLDARVGLADSKREAALYASSP